MKATTIAGLLAVAFWGVIGLAVSVQVGTGTPDFREWSPLPWHGMESSGLAGLTEAGLELNADLRPPRSAFELSLKMTSSSTLLFLFESPSPAGEIVLRLDGVQIEKNRVPQAGPWWVKLSDLPRRGILRVELNPYVKKLVIKAVYYPARACPSCPWLEYVLLGALVGLGAVLGWLWLSGRL